MASFEELQSKYQAVLDKGHDVGLNVQNVNMEGDKILIRGTVPSEYSKNQFQFDVIQDVVEMAQIVSKSRSTGMVLFGGGTPKTFIQQSETAAAMLHNTTRGHKFAVQIVTDSGDYGGYSGADFDQAQSFGKMSKNHRSVTVRCDATIAMPLLVTALSQTASKAMRTRKRIQFSFGKDLAISMP